ACDGSGGASTHDWYYAQAATGREGLAVNLLRRQAGDGHWDDTGGCNSGTGAWSTGWDVLILLKGVTIIPPTALICDCGNQQYDQNQDIVFNGTCSHHDDLNRTITLYEWDFNYNASLGFNVQASGSIV